ncbi:MAG: hypothetical protein M3088_00960 [Actinomycetota bacterium]|nr:hypothetical protein [Actinomycetota bacterium]
MGPSTVATCYRLLRAILGTAVEDSVIVKSPCVIKGAGIERPRERDVANVEQVFALAGAIDVPFRAMVLLATFTGLRLGELRALTRRHLDILRGTVNVVAQLQELASGEIIIGPPKSDAGRRTVAVPPAIVPVLEVHLGRMAMPGSYVGHRLHSWSPVRSQVRQHSPRGQGLARLRSSPGSLNVVESLKGCQGPGVQTAVAGARIKSRLGRGCAGLMWVTGAWQGPWEVATRVPPPDRFSHLYQLG